MRTKQSKSHGEEIQENREKWRYTVGRGDVAIPETARRVALGLPVPVDLEQVAVVVAAADIRRALAPKANRALYIAGRQGSGQIFVSEIFLARMHCAIYFLDVSNREGMFEPYAFFPC